MFLILVLLYLAYQKSFHKLINQMHTSVYMLHRDKQKRLKELFLEKAEVLKRVVTSLRKGSTSWIQKKNIHHVGCQVLEHVAWSCCDVSSFGDAPNSSGHDPMLRRELDLVMPRDPFQPKLFHDSVLIWLGSHLSHNLHYPNTRVYSRSVQKEVFLNL